MQIEYYTKNVYGLEKNYVKDTDMARKIQELTGNKTLTEDNMEALEGLGHKFVKVMS